MSEASTSLALLPLVYDELRRLAAQRMAHELPGQTLDATALVHEAWLRLEKSNAAGWDSRGHFFAAAAEAMRRILIERVRHKRRLKTGGGRHRIDFHEHPEDAGDLELLEIHELLDKLEEFDARKATLVKLRFFAGMTLDEAAKALGISPSTADNDWAYARCWLRYELEGRQKELGQSERNDAL